MSATPSEIRSYQQLHADKRARERLGVHFNRHIAHELIVQIKAGKLKPAAIGPGPGEWYKVDLEGREAWIFYNRPTDRIVTVMAYEPWQVRIPRLRREEAERYVAAASREEARARIAQIEQEYMFRQQMRITHRIFYSLLDIKEGL